MAKSNARKNRAHRDTEYLIRAGWSIDSYAGNLWVDPLNGDAWYEKPEALFLQRERDKEHAPGVDFTSVMHPPKQRKTGLGPLGKYHHKRNRGYHRD